MGKTISYEKKAAKIALQLANPDSKVGKWAYDIAVKAATRAFQDNKYDFEHGARHTFIRDDEVLGSRECTVEVDDPKLDETDFAHPAYFRGEDRAAKQVTRRLIKILDSGGDLQQLRDQLRKLTNE